MPLIIPAKTLADDAYEISGSCRFVTDSSSNLSRSFSSTASSWTVSFWTKLTDKHNTTTMYPWGFGTSGTDSTGNSFSSGGLAYYDEAGGTLVRDTSVLFRDPNAWSHIVCKNDGGTITLYTNGVQQAAGSGGTSLDGSTFYIGRWPNTSNPYHFDGYISEFYFIDGTAYSPSTFAETNSNGVWVPIEASPTFGSDGFFCEFKQTGSSANSSGMGADTSGNGNHLGVGGMGTDHITTDTPTNNFCVWNALEYSGDTALAEGNTEGYTRDGTADYHEGARGSIAVSNGKWYWEVKMVEVGDTSNALFAGIMSADHSFRNGEEDELLLGTYGMRNSDGDSVISNGSALAYATYGAAFVDGDILNLALDMDNNRLYIGKGGSWADGSGNIDEASINSYLTLSTTPSAYMPMVIGYSTGADIKYQANFGNAPYSISSGNADANGYGNFEYAVPSGFYALCTKNLAEYG